MFCHLVSLLSRLADILPGVPAELHLVAWLQLFLANSIAEILHFYTLVSTPDWIIQNKKVRWIMTGKV